MQTSQQSYGAGKALPGRKAQGQRKEDVSSAQKNGPNGGKKFKRGAKIHGNAKLKKQRPVCRVWWMEKGRHPDLEYYSKAARLRMEELGWTERDLAAAMGISPSCVHNLLCGSGTRDMEVDRRVHAGLGLEHPALHERAKALRLEEENDGV